MKIGFIGFGKMGSALADGVSWMKVRAYDPRARKASRRVSFDRSVAELVKRSDIVFICVKPQQMPEVLRDLAGITKRTLKEKSFVSIAAGIRLSAIQSVLGPDISVVRVMPNTPALLRSGVSAVSAGRRVKRAHVRAVESVLKSVGRVVRLPERKMDAVTAVSGSGPAYVFFLAEAMIDGAKKEGLSAGEARALVHQTIYGAGRMLANRPESAQALRIQVTSPGGTTAAAIREFERRKLKRIIKSGIRQATRRSRDLSKFGA